MPPRSRSSNGPDPTNQRERQWHGTRIRSRTRSLLEQPKTSFYLKLAGPLLLALGPLFGAPTVCVLLCCWIDSRPRRSGCSMSGVGAVIGGILYILSILLVIVTGVPIHTENGWKWSGNMLEDYLATILVVALWMTELAVTYLLLLFAVFLPEFHPNIEEPLPDIPLARIPSRHNPYERGLPDAEPPLVYQRGPQESAEESALERVPSNQAPSYRSDRGPPPSYRGPEDYFAAALQPHQDAIERRHLRRIGSTRTSRSTMSFDLGAESSSEDEGVTSSDTNRASRFLEVPRVPRRPTSLFSTHRTSINTGERRQSR